MKKKQEALSRYLDDVDFEDLNTDHAIMLAFSAGWDACAAMMAAAQSDDSFAQMNVPEPPCKHVTCAGGCTGC